MDKMAQMNDRTTADTKNDDDHDKEDNGLDEVPNAVKLTIGADEASINKNEEMSDYGGHYNDTNDSSIDDEANIASTINPNATWINNNEATDCNSHNNATNDDGINANMNEGTEGPKGASCNDTVMATNEAETKTGDNVQLMQDEPMPPINKVEKCDAKAGNDGYHDAKHNHGHITC